MMTGRSWMPAWTTVAALGLAAIGSTATEASDFIHFNYNKYLPNSVRSKIESYVGKVDVASGRIATAPANPIVVSSPTVAMTAVPDSSACLTKQYLATGAVLFKDACTKEWAINSTTVARHRPVAYNCLTKNRDTGVVMFRDTCTSEWAMNILERQAEPPQ